MPSYFFRRFFLPRRFSKSGALFGAIPNLPSFREGLTRFANYLRVVKKNPVLYINCTFFLRQNIQKHFVACALLSFPHFFTFLSRNPSSHSERVRLYSSFCTTPSRFKILAPVLPIEARKVAVNRRTKSLEILFTEAILHANYFCVNIFPPSEASQLQNTPHIIHKS